MSSSIQLFITDRRQEKWVETAASLAKTFSERAERYDRENEFPFENFRDLKEAGFHKLTLPRKYGGEEISLTEFVLIQETLATGCASTALGLGWHLGIMMNIRETGAWPKNATGNCAKKLPKKAPGSTVAARNRPPAAPAGEEGTGQPP